MRQAARPCSLRAGTRLETAVGYKTSSLWSGGGGGGLWCSVLRIQRNRVISPSHSGLLLQYPPSIQIATITLIDGRSAAFFPGSTGQTEHSVDPGRVETAPVDVLRG